MASKLNVQVSGIDQDMRDPAAPKLRILLLVNDMGFGGAEIQVADLARNFAALGHRVAVCVLVRYLEFERDLQDAGVETFALEMRYGRPSLDGMVKLASILKRFAPDVVHSHLYGATIVARLARLLRGFPVLVSTSHTPFERNRTRYLLAGLTDGLSDVWTNVCSKGIEEHIAQRAVTRERAVHMPNGIDLGRFAIPSARARLHSELGVHGRFVWLTVGSFRDEQKDYSNLLVAMHHVRQKHPGSLLLVVGAGALQDEKRREATRLGLDPHVRFLGHRRDISELMTAADGFVMGSAWEALPLVLLEASASGLPMVATDVGGNADILQHDETGFLVPAKDARALAAAMCRLIECTPAERRAFAERAREVARLRFDIRRVSAAWISLYRDALETRLKQPRRAPWPVLRRL